MKKVILSFILGLIVAGGIGVIAYNYNAKDIEYTPSDNSWNVNTVGDAIDSLITDKTKKTNYTFLDSSNTSFSIPDGVTSAYFIYSCGTNNACLVENIDGTILKNKTEVSYNSQTSNYGGGSLRAAVKIYKLELTGDAGTISCSVSGGAGSYRAWTAVVMY